MHRVLQGSRLCVGPGYCVNINPIYPILTLHTFSCNFPFFFAQPTTYLESGRVRKNQITQSKENLFFIYYYCFLRTAIYSTTIAKCWNCVRASILPEGQHIYRRSESIGGVEKEEGLATSHWKNNHHREEILTSLQFNVGKVENTSTYRRILSM